MEVSRNGSERCAISRRAACLAEAQREAVIDLITRSVLTC
jgi:hypothetical protein